MVIMTVIYCHDECKNMYEKIMGIITKYRNKDINSMPLNTEEFYQLSQFFGNKKLSECILLQNILKNSIFVNLMRYYKLRINFSQIKCNYQIIKNNIYKIFMNDTNLISAVFNLLTNI